MNSVKYIIICIAVLFVFNMKTILMVKPAYPSQNPIDMISYPILCCHVVLASNQPKHYILQLDTKSGTFGQKNYRTWLLLLLHSRQDGAGAQE